MKKIVVGVVLLAALVGTVAALGTRADAQARVFQNPDVTLLEGPGSSIGIMVRDVTSEDLDKAKLNQAGGALVTSTIEGGPGAQAGLRNGDIVTEFDGERVRSARHLTRLVRETPPGRTVKGSIVRNGSRQTLDITPETRIGIAQFPQIGREIERQLRELPRNFSLNIGPDFFARGGPRRLGVTLSPLGDQLASYFGVKQGALVSSVDADSPAARAGLKAGDVIVAVNGRNVESMSDVTASVTASQPGSTIEIKVVREKKEMTLKAIMPERSRPRAADSRRSREI